MSTRLSRSIAVRRSLGHDGSKAQTLSPCLYPMWLMPMATLLEMKLLRPHQHVRHMMVEYNQQLHEGLVIFVSHQWLSWQEPDPDNVHLDALKSVLRRLMSGKAGSVTADYQSRMVFGDRSTLSVAQLREMLPRALIWLGECDWSSTRES